MDEKGTVRLPEYHRSVRYQGVGDKVLWWSEQRKGSQADGICSLIAYIFMSTLVKQILFHL